MRSKGVGGTRAARQASPRTLAIAGGVLAVVIIAVVLAMVLSNSSSNKSSSVPWPAVGSHTWPQALPGAPDAYALFKGIPQKGLVLGSPNAPATLTEFIDLQCPVCQEFETTQLPDIVKNYVRDGKLNIRMEPWSIRGPDSNRGQAATIAASLQNKAFPFAQMLYFNQGQENTGWLNDSMVGYASSSVDGLRPQKVLDDTSSSGVVKNTINDVNAIAANAGYNATPTILLNHKGQKAHVVSVGLPDAATLKSQIESAISG